MKDSERKYNSTFCNSVADQKVNNGEEHFEITALTEWSFKITPILKESYFLAF